jgi:hypothetical protein
MGTACAAARGSHGPRPKVSAGARLAGIPGPSVADGVYGAGTHMVWKVERDSARVAGRSRGARVPGSVAGWTGLLACAAGVLAGGAGCSSAAAHSSAATAGATCGSTRTAVGVPVLIKVAKGTVNCGVAMRVENEYAAKVRNGQVAGTGGGAPVSVNGWTCQGYSTPELLSTGIASQCHMGSDAIVAVLPPVPTPTATGTAG